MIRLRRISGALVLLSAVLLGAVTSASAYVGSVDVPGAPVANETFSVVVAGDKPTPCYAVSVVEDESGWVEEGRIRLVFSLLDVSNGMACITVLDPFEFTHEFEGGFPAGDYVLEVVERTYQGEVSFTERTTEVEFEIVIESPGLAPEESAWGAIKALMTGADR